MDSSNKQKRVFVIHGRNEAARKAMFAFLRAIGLDPMEFGEIPQLTGVASPYIGEILDAAFSHAQAFVVLITGDDVARLGLRFQKSSDEQYESALTPQARPNVLFEAGMAMGRHPDRTVLVAFGPSRPFSDMGGRHVVQISNETSARVTLADKLVTAGCSVKTQGKSDWLTEEYFSVPTQPDTLEVEPSVKIDERGTGAIHNTKRKTQLRRRPSSSAQVCRIHAVKDESDGCLHLRLTNGTDRSMHGYLLEFRALQRWSKRAGNYLTAVRTRPMFVHAQKALKPGDSADYVLAQPDEQSGFVVSGVDAENTPLRVRAAVAGKYRCEVLVYIGGYVKTAPIVFAWDPRKGFRISKNR